MSLSRSLVCVSVAVACASPVTVSAGDHYPDRDQVHRVLLISVDGLHALDVERYIAAHPGSALAELGAHGVRFTTASSAKPSDSFPGLLALVTGGSPVSTGVFYDVSYDRKQWSPSNGGCGGAPGNASTYDETIDLVVNGKVQNEIDPALLPWGIKNGSCQRIYPHDFLQVNTLFEVVKAHRGQTAWADKHPAYDLVNGPSGKGVDDLYTPEITSPVDGGPDYTVGVLCAAENDGLKVQAILNEIRGLDHSGARAVGVPTLFGMNFQAVSVGQKVTGNTTPKFCKATRTPAATALEGKPESYLDGSGTPTAVLDSALGSVDAALAQMIKALKEQGLSDTTLIIVSAKHGQAPVDPLLVNKPGKLESLVSALPGAGSDPAAAAIAAATITEDDVTLLWLADQSQTEQVASYLRKNAGALHIQQVLAGASLQLMFRNPRTDARTPDLIVLPVLGTIYTTSAKKLAEHGGFSSDDTNVGLIVSKPGLRARVVKSPVETSQVAPTILEALRIDPNELQAVRREGTAGLPGLDLD